MATAKFNFSNVSSKEHKIGAIWSTEANSSKKDFFPLCQFRVLCSQKKAFSVVLFGFQYVFCFNIDQRFLIVRPVYIVDYKNLCNFFHWYYEFYKRCENFAHWYDIIGGDGERPKGVPMAAKRSVSWSPSSRVWIFDGLL